MEGFSLRTSCVDRFLLPRRISRTTNTSLSPNNLNFRVFASKDDSKLDHWDQMELKFGQMIGEDPKLTLAKIMGRKSNPDVSYLEIEKSFIKKKGKLDDDDGGGIVNVPFEEEEGRPSSNSLNLIRPVPTKKGIKFKLDSKPIPSEKKSSASVKRVADSPTKGSNAPKVILRKPSTFQEDPIEAEKLKIKPNLMLKMRREESKENFSDITLLKKPETVKLVVDPNQDKITSGDSIDSGSGSVLSAGLETSNEAKPTDDLGSSARNDFDGPPESSSESFSKVSEQEDVSKIGLQPLEQSEFGFSAKESDKIQSLGTNSVVSTSNFSMQAALQGKPKMLDQSTKERSPVKVETVRVSNNSDNDHAEIEHFMAAPLQEREEADWIRAENLLKTGGREEVELISCSARGFVASFGSLIGFLPYRNLGAKWKFLAFESWLRKKGLDPSKYKQNISITGGYEAQNKSLSPDMNLNPTMDQKIEGKLSPDMTLEDLLEIYDQEKLKFLSSFVGQKIKVNLVLADRNTRKLMFSGRPKEKEETVEKKRSLMAKLSVGDVVKCCIKKITYFGIFVEVEGVPALIHQSEVSWDATLDPSSSFRIGQIIEAKVHQLDFGLERITLSLKEITPDPLIEALESVVGERNSLDGSLEVVQTDVEWADVESLIKELQQIEGVQSVSKGRFFLSPGLAPTFQVYMASMFENQYKLLARSGNKVQEVIVLASLDKEKMKAAILTGTNRVE